MGIRYIVLNKEIAKVHKLPVDYGALVIRESLGEGAVVPNSSAAKAGLKEYDIILEINGEKVTEEKPLGNILQNYKIGEELSLKVLREKQEIPLKVKLEEKK